jgi:hypothetical protein
LFDGIEFTWVFIGIGEQIAVLQRNVGFEFEHFDDFFFGHIIQIDGFIDLDRDARYELICDRVHDIGDDIFFEQGEERFLLVLKECLLERELFQVEDISLGVDLVIRHVFPVTLHFSACSEIAVVVFIEGLYLREIDWLIFGLRQHFEY